MDYWPVVPELGQVKSSLVTASQDGGFVALKFRIVRWSCWFNKAIESHLSVSVSASLNLTDRRTQQCYNFLRWKSVEQARDCRVRIDRTANLLVDLTELCLRNLLHAALLATSTS